MTADADSTEHGSPTRARWPLLAVALVLVLAIAAGTWWWLRDEDLSGVWIGRLDTLQIELHLADDGRFDWYVQVPGAAPPPPGGRPLTSQWTGTWQMTEGELELRYDPKPPRKEGGVRYGQLMDGTLRTTFGLGGERAVLRRPVP